MEHTTKPHDLGRPIAVKNGMVTLYWDTMDKVRQGITSVDEALARVMPDEFDSKPPEWA